VSRRSEWKLCTAAAIWSFLFAVCAVSAKILHTRQEPSANWDPWLPLTIGSGIEFETNKEDTQYDFPMLLEYNFTQTLKLTVEPTVEHISSKVKGGRTVTGLGDMETSLEYEFVRERRYRPALTVEGLINWPTATDRDIGSPRRDYSLGLVVSKDLVFVDVDLSALYTFVEDSKKQETFEISIAGEWHLNHLFDVEGELIHSFGTGGIRGSPGSISAIGEPGGARGDLTEGALGVAWHINKRFKLEHGAILRSDGTWQIVFAWEWRFSGD
jgi:hypothetical protein